MRLPCTGTGGGGFLYIPGSVYTQIANIRSCREDRITLRNEYNDLIMIIKTISKTVAALPLMTRTSTREYEQNFDKRITVKQISEILSVKILFETLTFALIPKAQIHCWQIPAGGERGLLHRGEQEHVGCNSGDVVSVVT